MEISQNSLQEPRASDASQTPTTHVEVDSKVEVSGSSSNLQSTPPQMSTPLEKKGYSEFGGGGGFNGIGGMERVLE
eukprot:1336935-Amorphochlora_amoeboformis.AAC.1